MPRRDYLSEFLSIQCERVHDTIQRLKTTGALSDEDRMLLGEAQDAVIALCDRFRVTKNENKEVNMTAEATKWRTPYGTETVAVAAETKAATKPAEDVVNHPNHYFPNGRDSFMHMKDQMGKDAFDGFLQGNVIKYVQRYAFKGKPTEDLCKAAFYLFHLAFETTDGSKGAVTEVFARVATTLNHAFEHYKTEAK